MTNVKLVLGILILLVSLIVSAGFFYDRLEDRAEPTSLIVFDSTDTSPLTPQGVTGGGDTEKAIGGGADSGGEGKTDGDENISGEGNTDGGEGNTEVQKPEMTIPDFTVYDRDGNQVKLSDFIGKPIVLNFFASWCGPCKSEMPDFEAKYREIGDGVQFLMINLTDGYYETVKSATDFIDGAGYTFPVFFDTDSSAATAYNVVSIPTTYFIDANGNIVARATGAISAATLAEGIGMIS